MIGSYDEQQKYFIPLPELPTQKSGLIASLIKNEVEALLNNLQNVKKRTGAQRLINKITMDWNEIEEILGELSLCIKSGTAFIQIKDDNLNQNLYLSQSVWLSMG